MLNVRCRFIFTAPIASFVCFGCTWRRTKTRMTFILNKKKEYFHKFVMTLDQFLSSLTLLDFPATVNPDDFVTRFIGRTLICVQFPYSSGTCYSLLPFQQSGASFWQLRHLLWLHKEGLCTFWSLWLWQTTKCWIVSVS